MFQQGAMQVAIDSNGRILIPKSLLQHAGVSREIVLSANIDQFEIWDKVTYDNLINENWDEIKPSLLLDKRIGRFAYIRPGLGITSGNLQRDMINLNELTSKYKLNYPNLILKNINKYSSYKKNWILNILKKLIINNKKVKIGLLGLTYKENITSLKNSNSIYLIKKLKNHFFNIYDPKINNKVKYKNVKEYSKISDVLNKSEIIIVATPWKQFKNLNFNRKNIRNIIDLKWGTKI